MKNPLAMASVLALLLACLPLGAQDTKPVRMPGKDKWNKKEIPELIPEYTFGAVINYGSGGQNNWFLVYCEEDKKADFDKYLASLAGMGWQLKENTQSGKILENDGDTLTVTWLAANKMVAIELHKANRIINWPQKEFPELPPWTAKARSIIFKVYEINSIIALVGITDEDMAAWQNTLAKAGWTGGDGSWDIIRKDGRTLRVSADRQGDGEWNLDLGFRDEDEESSSGD